MMRRVATAVVAAIAAATATGLGRAATLGGSPVAGNPPLVASPIAVVAPAQARPDRRWPDEVLYLVMTDRFARGPTGTPLPGTADPFAWHGGDLAGLTAHLDDLRALGVTALWLTPFVQQQAVPDHGHWPYHGYWIADFDRVDPHFGSEADLVELVAQAHRRGLKVLFDAVANHEGYEAPDVTRAASASWFHHNGPVTDWDDPYQNENYDVAGLPDLNTEDSRVLDRMVAAWGGWLARTGADGLRMDTVRHVPVPFWHAFTGRLRARLPRTFLLGEVSYHRSAAYPPYLTTGGYDSVFDFPLTDALQDVFARGAAPTRVAQALQEAAALPHSDQLVRQLDNHDMPRFLTLAGGDQRKLRLALACLATLPGIPCLYYGTEEGMLGGPDPDDRRDMAFGHDPALRAYVARLLNLRAHEPALRRGGFTVVEADAQVLAYARRGETPVLVVLNNADAPRHRTLRLDPQTGIPRHAKLVDALTGHAVRVDGRSLELALSPKQAQIWVAQGAGR